MLTQALLKPLLKSEKGKIINISSVSGILGNAGQTNYSAAKAGVISLTSTCKRAWVEILMSMRCARIYENEMTDEYLRNY